MIKEFNQEIVLDRLQEIRKIYPPYDIFRGDRLLEKRILFRKKYTLPLPKDDKSGGLSESLADSNKTEQPKSGWDGFIQGQWRFVN